MNLQNRLLFLFFHKHQFPGLEKRKPAFRRVKICSSSNGPLRLSTIRTASSVKMRNFIALKIYRMVFGIYPYPFIDHINLIYFPCSIASTGFIIFYLYFYLHFTQRTGMFRISIYIVYISLSAFSVFCLATSPLNDLCALGAFGSILMGLAEQ